MIALAIIAIVLILSWISTRPWAPDFMKISKGEERRAAGRKPLVSFKIHVK